MHRQRKTQVWTVFILLLIMFLCVSPIGMAQEGTWARKADMKFPRGGLSTAVVDGKIYAIGGVTRVGEVALRVFSTVEVYDPKRNAWTKLPSMLTPRWGLATSTVNGKIYAVGGRRFAGPGPLSTVEAYDPKRKTWSSKAHMPTARETCSTSVVNGKIYAIGGGGGVQYVEVYDPATDTWTQRGFSPTGRWASSTSVVNGKIYAIGGGKVLGGNGLARVDVYDPVADVWAKKADMPSARVWLSTSVVNGKIYAMTRK